MNPVEQTLLYATSIVVLAGTLTVFVVQYVRMRRRDRGDDARGGDDGGRGPGDGGRGPGDGGRGPSDGGRGPSDGGAL